MDWRDLKVALALDRHGSHLAAGRALRVDATTVGRRIEALEAALGASVFQRTPDGWRATPEGRRVIDAAARMAEEVRSLSRELAVDRIAGTVRITTLDEVATTLLVPNLAALHARHPDLVVDLRCTAQIVDLVSGHADVALRLSRPTESGVRVRRIATVYLGIHASPTWIDSGCDAALVVFGSLERPLPETRWLRQTYPGARIALRTDSVPTATEAIRAGLGIGVVALGLPGLVRLDDGPPMERPLWRVVPDALADTPRVRAVVDWLDAITGSTWLPAGFPPANDP